MRFYTNQHHHYCILDRDGQVLVHKNLPANPEAFLEVVAPYRDDLFVAVECIFTWYWLADLCAAACTSSASAGSCSPTSR